MAKLKLKIVSPEKSLFEGETDSISLPTPLGQITVLPNHIPLVSSLAPGELIIIEHGNTRHLAVSGGVIEVRKSNEIVILADAAETAEEIDVARAEEARERARKIMSEKILSDEEYAATAAALEKALARIRVSRRHRNRSTHTTQTIS
jgi:F-type H+-transporting ATPase subunit epsilon